jgi:hypothetical protein
MIFYGFWMIPFNNPARVSFDPSVSYDVFSLYSAYQRSFNLIDQGFLGFGYRGFSLYAEGSFINLPSEDEFSGTYGEFSANFGYSFSPVEGMRLGASLSYYQINNPRPDVGNRSSFGLNLGASFKVYEFWKVGIFAKNLNSPEIGGFPLQTFVGSYISFSPREDITTALGVLKDQYGPVNYGIGGEWKMAEILKILASVRYDGRVPSYFAGLSLNVRYFQFINLFQIHPDLPISYHVGFSWAK